ncbi:MULTISPECIES: UDP-N-acetyl-D-mannosamine dehydrogenase [Campylobacter]|uniref:UDP-N-acetyl-D-mannosamine dehydrogenase n=1 Tax=Campylobacter TaxID=194 RepID=UPI00027A39DF|nr:MULTISPECIES: UDP-N-acetyl-D-mannosamine dehydrogenase [Campylobacter]EJP74347.1 nucleotide sugar dehydrogenase [Campylobacter sp. FOBRC14]QKF61472.1 UDP-N-acetyl-D-mannosaminuronic acid dehydrogenase [Campylobacter curvus]UEB50859.1 UDP-N-acetyl-D-mannosamine dehydrogenase [Campylobacter curvus]
MNRKICIIGLGYIGLPTAALLASKGYDVHGVDVSSEVVETINGGRIHIVEPELDLFVKAAVTSGRLKADTKPKFADIFIIAVPTPFKNDYEPNLDYVEAAAKSIAPFVKSGNIVILESTSPVGTTELVKKRVEECGTDTSGVYFAHCPERVLPGKIMKELVNNDRIVGGLSDGATKKTSEFYKTFVNGEVLQTDARTAEMSKLVENSFRDVNIAFANELSMICDKFNIDVWELIRLANRHPRVNILSPGCGVGGHCIAVDPWFIVHAAKNEARLIKTSREVNNYKTKWAIEKIKNAALEFENKNRKKAKIACMGLAFKPNIDDLRESPALFIAKELSSAGFDVLAVEPNIKTHKELEIVNFKDAVVQADIVVFLVAHKEFKEIYASIKDRYVIDFAGLINV